MILANLLSYYVAFTSYMVYENCNGTGSGVFVRNLQFLTDS
jgi:hypothetical protein